MAIVLTVILVLVVRIGLSFCARRMASCYGDIKLYEVRYLLSATMYYRSLSLLDRRTNQLTFSTNL